MKKILILFIAFTSFGLFAQTTSNDYFDRAYSKSDVKDYYGAIADYTKAIELTLIMLMLITIEVFQNLI